MNRMKRITREKPGEITREKPGEFLLVNEGLELVLTILEGIKNQSYNSVERNAFWESYELTVLKIYQESYLQVIHEKLTYF